MKLKLLKDKDVTPTSIKKINKILTKETLVFITAEFCSFCTSFAPEKEKFINNNNNINIIDIENEALNFLRIQNNDIYKLLIPTDRKVFFPMILHIQNKHGRFIKKLYEGERTADELKKKFCQHKRASLRS